jgi:ATP-dependent DNA helicase RecG
LAIEPLLITGSLPARERKAAAARLAIKEPVLVVGTHALVQGATQFANLGFAAIDEQHRFGVEQRKALAGKGEFPDVLLMSATPIPRSLALTLYGDLDLSMLDERPPGRQPVTTALRRESGRSRVLQFVDRQIELGRQAYIVYPVIEESEKTDLKAATTMFETLSSGPFSHRRMALLHGRIPSDERDDVMRRFRDRQIDILVATTVIEVGIDIPNATVMLVEHPERFGLSQLHQLRGARRPRRGRVVLHPSRRREPGGRRATPHFRAYRGRIRNRPGRPASPWDGRPIRRATKWRSDLSGRRSAA